MNRRASWVLIALCALTLGVYFQVGGHDFVNLDDFDYVTDNPNVNAGLTAEGVRAAFTGTHSANWHPLTTLSHMLDVQLFGLDAGPMHLLNVLFHLANTVLLFRLLHAATGSTWRSALVAGLFALHPLHVESVAWISERKDVLSTFFWLAAMLAYSAWVRRPSVLRYVSVAALFVLGLLSKPMLVTLPLVLILWDAWPLGRIRSTAGFKASVVEKLPLLALSVAHGVVTLQVQGAAGATASSYTIPFATRVGNALATYARYVQDTIAPVGLSPSYPHQGAAPVWAIALGVLGIVFVLVLAWAWRERRPWWGVAWLWYLGTLLPVIGLVQVGSQSRADRYTYVPMIGLAIAFAWGIEAVTRKGSLARTIAVQLVVIWGLALVAITVVQVARWKDGPTLFGYVLSRDPDNYQIHEALAVELARCGNVPAAVPHFEHVVRGLPDRAASRFNLALAYLQTGDRAAGIAELNRALDSARAAGNGALVATIETRLREVEGR
jgi:hypothetical protein